MNSTTDSCKSFFLLLTNQKLGTEQLLLLQHETSILERQEEERLRARARALIYEAEPNEEVEIQRAREKVCARLRLRNLDVVDVVI